ncbi:MAG: ABC-2 family transporter protein [Candidatus Daviesbacteria bacterium]
MNKYLQLIKASFQEYFVYRLNFILWRVRALMQLAILFFLWSTVYQGTPNIFGYSEGQMLTYVLGISLIRSYILAARLSENVGAEIVTGNLTNLLLKPISYLKYVFSRDLSDKGINIFFSSLEITGFILIFKPSLLFQQQPIYLVFSALAVILALLLYFFVNITISYSAFWLVNDWWAPRFVFGIALEFLAGGIFPIDILPKIFAQILFLTPFPYMLFFPMKIYLGQLTLLQISQGLAITVFWVLAFYYLQKWLWGVGLRRYEAVGR